MEPVNTQAAIVRVDEPVANKLKCPKFKLSRTVSRRGPINDILPEENVPNVKKKQAPENTSNSNKDVAYLVAGAVVAFTTLVSFTVYALKRT